MIGRPDNFGVHVRYDSDEFAYSGCEHCDRDGDTLGWPCPTVARVRRRRSVACVRYEAPPGSGVFVGCGAGWCEDDEPSTHAPMCKTCRRVLVITGRFVEVSLR
jgi:hypothetical protein